MIYDILIVDGNGLACRAFSVLQLRNEKGESTSVAYGVLNMIRSIMGKYEFDDVCVCWDWKGSNSKKEKYPEYKKKRPNKDNNFSGLEAQIEDLIKILPHFGIKQLRRKGVEADDIIGLLTIELQKLGKRVLILSSDKDMFQLIDKGMDVYYPPKDILLTKENFEAELGMKPENWIFYRTLVGDVSDNIKGLKGFGEVTSKKLLDRFGPWPEWFDGFNTRLDVLLSVSTAQRKMLQDGIGALATLTLNYQLMLVGFLDSEILDDLMKEFNEQVPEFNDAEIKDYFVEKCFNSYINRYHSWSHPFRRLGKHGKICAGKNSNSHKHYENSIEEGTKNEKS